MKKFFVAALFAAVFAFAANAAAPTAPTVLPAKNGNVTFEHAKHAALKCETCHATAAGGKIEGFGKDKAHGTCVECHKKEAKGPQKCTECHKKA
ncbi:MAG TPA: cytochrome c3 family protein [Anaeromyxobacteraceae bacterium]|nr:cytochrome c3 family protein [Anaeromyxobacteraceae bacterium]